MTDQNYTFCLLGVPTASQAVCIGRTSWEIKDLKQFEHAFDDLFAGLCLTLDFFHSLISLQTVLQAAWRLQPGGVLGHSSRTVGKLSEDGHDAHSGDDPGGRVQEGRDIGERSLVDRELLRSF